jgi:DNA-binding NarL/FixJ family response regulator
VEEVMERFGGAIPRFDVVVTDVHLPGESGVDFARRIKASEPGQAVVFITGDSDNDIARAALRSGSSGFLVKPFQVSEIETAVRNAVQRQKGNVTVNVNVVMAPARRHRVQIMPRLRAAAAVAALLALGWLAGAGFSSEPANKPADSMQASADGSNKPAMVPVVIERPVYKR